MGCCKCCAEMIGWPDPQPVVYHDAQGDDFCVFHAPVDSKYREFGSSIRLTVEEFNKLIAERIATVRVRHANFGDDEYCELNQVIFPGSLEFNSLLRNNTCPSVSLFNAQFFGDASFESIKFVGHSVFSGVVFHNEASFIDVTFSNIANFGGVKCKSEFSIFDSTINNMDFTHAEFAAPCSICNNTISDTAKFSWASFLAPLFVHGNSAIQNSMFFDGVSDESLRLLSFESVDVDQISSFGVTFPQILYREYDDFSSYDGCEELYRAMKRKAISEHNQLLASRWHFREKFMQLKQLFNNDSCNELIELVEDSDATWFDRTAAWFKLLLHRPHLPKLTLTGIYWATSGFGERATRAGVALAILVGLAWLLNVIPAPVDWEHGWGAYTANATMASIPFAKDIPGEGWLKVGRGLMQFCIALQFTLFALAVRNRFRR